MKIVTTEHQCRYSGGTALTVALALVLVILAMLAMANPARAADLSVTRNTNSGIGTLRQAVDTANGNTEADTITFNLPEGQRTIRLTSQINFTAPQETTVDGTDQSVTVSGNNETRVFQVNSGANLAMKRLTVSNGNTGQSGSDGGGIYNNGTLNVTDSTVSGNDATFHGGGVYNYNGLTTIRSTTITDNTAPKGSGVASEAISLTSTVVGNSIIAANSTTDVDLFRPSNRPSPNSFTSEGHNVVGDGDATAAFNQTGDQTGVADPRLNPLADNGGPTKTHGLLPGSPAIDKGDTALATDQRGIARPQDGDGNGTPTDDVGSVENTAVFSFSSASYMVNEGAGTATIAVTRAGNLDGVVTVDYATSNGTATAGYDYLNSRGTLTFTSGDALEEFTVPITDDRTDEQDETLDLTLSNPGGAAILGTRNTVPLTITDDDTAGITVTPTSGLTTTEAHGSATFTVALNSQPTSTVTIPLSSSDTTEGTVFPNSLTFTPVNNGTPRTVTVTGVNDNADDGDIAYEIVTGAAVSSDPGYSGVDASNGSATNTDDDDTPVAENDTYTTPEDRTLDISAPGVLGNDADGDDGNLEARLVDDVDRGTLTLNSDGAFTYIPEPDVSYTTTFTYEACDDGGLCSEPATVEITVNSVNDAPSFTKGADQSVAEDSGARTVPNFATDISPGPTDEATQNVTFAVTNANNALFSTQPSISSDGTLTYTPAPDINGSANVTVKARDNGPGASPNDNEGDPQTFTITVTLVDDTPPSANAKCTITGTKRGEALNGTPGDDVICGLGGDDAINGRGGNDRLIGGDGNDGIIGGTGEDALDGGAGKDGLNARDDAGGDELDGGAGKDGCATDPGDSATNC